MLSALLLVLSGTVQSTPPGPHGAIPSSRQLAWHARGFYAFVHFGPNTFSGNEWGSGAEPESLFHPTDFDARQWVDVFRAAGMRGVILTAKHHDGFCLWPSRHTRHSVASSPWREGRGDVVREVADACRAAGLAFGVYVSPWDRNHPAYGRDDAAYNDFFAAQLEELLTGYGPLFEVWFDGANGERGDNAKFQEYDWPRFIGLVRQHQPDAVIFSDTGPDVRWVGNESGFVGDTNWATMRARPMDPGGPSVSIEALNRGEEGGDAWLPAEVDVSIRPGWFHRASEDGAVKSLDDLIRIWRQSWGRGANLLLNVPPDRRGRIGARDEAVLRDFGLWLAASAQHDLALGRPVDDSRPLEYTGRFGPIEAIDGDPGTFWVAEGGVHHGWISVELAGARLFDQIVLEEAIELGQRVRAFAIDARLDGLWMKVATGTTIGPRRAVAFERCLRADGVRVRITDARAVPTLRRLSVFKSPPRVRVSAREPDFLESTTVELAADQEGWAVHYTLDGTAPTRRSPRAEGPVTVERTCTLRAVAIEERTPSPLVSAIELRRWKESLRGPIVFVRAPDPGLGFRAWERAVTSLAELDALLEETPARSGTAARIDLAPSQRAEEVVLAFDGYFAAPRDGVYTFELASDDGSRLWIGETLVVDNDGLHGRVARSGVIGLGAGWHPLRVAAFNAKGAAALEARVRGGGLDQELAGPLLGR